MSKLIKSGKRAELSKELIESTDPIHAALRTAMEMCWENDWTERASAKEVADFLLSEKGKIDALHSSNQ